MKPETIKIDDVEYIRADSVSKLADTVKGMKYCIVRTYSAGVFAGYIESRSGQEVVIRNARRLWYWNGAASLSQMAMEGVSKPESCKFSVPVERSELFQVIEILDCTERAKQCIEGVSLWKA
jgi:hypothetical protein